MEASSAGAKLKGGLTVGIIPSDRKEDANQYTDIIIVTDMGHARNIIIAQSCDAMIAVGGSYGTISEMAIALKLGKNVVAIAEVIGWKSWRCCRESFKRFECVA